MKRLLVITLSMLFVFGLSACGGSEEEVCENRADEGVEYFFDQDQTETETITVWLDDDDYANALIDAFEAQNPGIRVRFQEVGSVDVRQQLELYSGSSAVADVVVFPHDHIGAALQSNLLYVVEGQLELDLRERMILSATETASACYDFDNNQVIDCEGDAERYLFGAPLSGESIAFFYNKDLLEELTGSREPAQTFEEIIAQYEEHEDTLREEYGELMIAMDVGNAYDMHFLATAFGYELFGPEGLDSDQANLDSDEMVAALDYMHNTLRPALSNFDSGDLDGEANRSLFEAGDLPYIIDGPWSISRYENADLDFGVSRIPTIQGQQPITFSGVQMAAVYSQTENEAAAFRFLEFMTSDEGLAIMYEQTNRLPALEDVSVIEAIDDDEYLPGISDQMNYSQPMPIIPEMGFFWDNAGAMYGAAWNGTLSPQEAAEEAQAGFDGSR